MRISLICAILVGSFPAFSQTITGSLGGVVKDPTGALIAGAQVQVTNMATNITTRLATNNEGAFLAPSLPPGPYTVAVEAQGFKKTERSGIVLDVNQAIRLDLAMELGMATETVQVSGQASLLETATATMGQTVENRSIVNLPLNSRNSWSLVFLAPGVQGNVGDKYNNVNISINGGRPGSTAMMVDGIPSSTALTNPVQGFTIFPGVDTVQEFKVESNTYSAEFGRSGTGIINLVYKSGTNQLHGSAFEFLRNSVLDANSFFSNMKGVGLPSFKRSQFGGSISGPVYIPKVYNGHNKTFFLFGYEGLRESSAATMNTTVPTELQRAGNFSETRAANGNLVVVYDPATTKPSGSGFVRQAFPGNVIPASRFDPVSAKVVKYYPLPNTAGARYTNANNFYVPSTAGNPIDNYDAKVDENLNDQHRFFVRASRRIDDNVPANYFPEEVRVAQGGVETRDTFINSALDYTYTRSATLLADFRLGYARATEDRLPRSLGFNPIAELGMPSYMRGAQVLMFPGFQPAGYQNLGNGGSSQWGPAGYNTYSLGVNMMKVLPSHLLKFGFDYRVMQANVSQGTNFIGTFSFARNLTQGPDPNKASTTAGDGFASELLGVGSGPLTINRNTATQSEYYAWYVADDWKVSRRLTLNIGFRYGIDLPETERYNRVGNFDPAIPSPLAGPAGLPNLTGGIVFAGVNGASRRVAPTDFNGWDPRFGFAYHATQHTVLRGGFGIFHDASILDASAVQRVPGYDATSSFVSAADGVTPAVYVSNPFPDGLQPITGNSAGLLSGVGTAITPQVARDNRVAYTENWSLNLQQQLPGNVMVEAGYVGSHGVQLPFFLNGTYLNQLRPEQLSSKLQQQVQNPFYGLITTGPLATRTVPYSYLAAPYPQYLSIQVPIAIGAVSNYHSLQIKAEKRFGSGLSFLVAYTAQKLIDDCSTTAVVGGASSLQNIYNRPGERALSSNNVSQLLTVSYVYELPFGRHRRFGSGWNRGVDAALGGWQVNGITTFSTGLPVLVTTQNTSGAGGAVLRPNNNGHSANLTGPVENRLSKYFDTSVFSQPAPFTFGNTGRTLPDVRVPGARNFDFSLFKNFAVWERMSLQLRAETFNLMNTPRFDRPNQALNNAQFGVISGTANGPRQLQFALKLLF